MSISDLRLNKVKSCGCIHKETSKELGIKNKKFNNYDLSGEYGIGYDSNGKEFWFDLEDYSKIKDYCWMIANDGYVKCSNENKLLHRIIMNLDDNQFDVDHIHGKDTKHDNRKCNLRIATRSQNIINKGLMKNNTSGVTGVTWNKRKQKWIVRININKKRIIVDSFDNFEDAVKARKQAEEKHYGEWSYDNSQKYNIKKE